MWIPPNIHAWAGTSLHSRRLSSFFACAPGVYKAKCGQARVNPEALVMQGTLLLHCCRATHSLTRDSWPGARGPPPRLHKGYAVPRAAAPFASGHENIPPCACVSAVLQAWCHHAEVCRFCFIRLLLGQSALHHAFCHGELLHATLACLLLPWCTASSPPARGASRPKLLACARLPQEELVCDLLLSSSHT